VLLSTITVFDEGLDCHDSSTQNYLWDQAEAVTRILYLCYAWAFYARFKGQSKTQ